MAAWAELVLAWMTSCKNRKEAVFHALWGCATVEWKQESGNHTEMCLKRAGWLCLIGQVSSQGRWEQLWKQETVSVYNWRFLTHLQPSLINLKFRFTVIDIFVKNSYVFVKHWRWSVILRVRPRQLLFIHLLGESIRAALSMNCRKKGIPEHLLAVSRPASFSLLPLPQGMVGLAGAWRWGSPSGCLLWLTSPWRSAEMQQPWSCLYR